MKKLLPYHPIPADGESHRGYLLRVTTGNGYLSTSWLRDVPGFLDYMNTGLGGVLRGNRTAWTSPYQLEGSSRSTGVLPFTHAKEAKFCVKCLREKGIWRVEWESTYYVACHHHNVSLRSTCALCGRMQTSNRRRLLECNCGSSFLAQPCSPADAAEIAISRQIFQLQYNGQLVNSTPSICEIIGDFNYISVCKFIRAIGRRFPFSVPISKASTRSHISQAMAREHVMDIARLLYDWPNSFASFLLQYGELENTAPGKYKRSARLTNLLRKLPWSWADSKTPLSRVITDVLARYEPRVLDGRQGNIPPERHESCRFSHITVVGRELRVTSRRIAELIEAGEISAFRRVGGKRDFILIPNEEIDRINSLLDDAISHKAAAKLLGISQNRLSQLHQEGLIRASKKNHFPNTRYSVNDLTFLVKRLKIEISPYAREELETVAHICKFAIASKVEFIDIMQALVDGRLIIYGQDENLGSVGGLLLSRSEWHQWREQQRPNQDTLSIVAASEQLGIKQEVAYHLLRKGMIKAYCGISGRRKTKLLSFENLTAFKKAYVSAVELATVYGTSPKAMIETLSRQQIFPITGPRVDGCRQYFYLRADFGQQEDLSNANFR